MPIALRNVTEADNYGHLILEHWQKIGVILSTIETLGEYYIGAGAYKFRSIELVVAFR